MKMQSANSHGTRTPIRLNPHGHNQFFSPLNASGNEFAHTACVKCSHVDVFFKHPGLSRPVLETEITGQGCGISRRRAPSCATCTSAVVVSSSTGTPAQLRPRKSLSSGGSICGTCIHAKGAASRVVSARHAHFERQCCSSAHVVSNLWLNW